MWHAGDSGRRQALLQLAASLRETGLVDTAELLEAAYDREARIVALEIPDQEATLRVREERPEKMLELRATLQEHVWRKREGLQGSKPTRASFFDLDEREVVVVRVDDVVFDAGLSEVGRADPQVGVSGAVGLDELERAVGQRSIT